MIVVQLKGGLGNQLFQYAAALSLARHHGVELKIDVCELQSPDKLIKTNRQLELSSFNIDLQIASQQEIASFLQQPFFKRYFQKLLPPYKRLIYKEADFSFDEHFFEASNHLYLKGYRQSEKYFLSIEKEIRQVFTLKPEIIQQPASIEAKLKQENSLSIHIRRGDYRNAAVMQHHGILDATYYTNAIDKIRQLKTDVKLYVFTDDPQWAKENLSLNDATIISQETSKNHFEDFYLMSCCQHNIIANSSFSWWAAWLNPNPDKLIIAPQKWFNTTEHDTKDLIPNSWIRI
jgi:hypothetical protein